MAVSWWMEPRLIVKLDSQLLLCLPHGSRFMQGIINIQPALAQVATAVAVTVDVGVLMCCCADALMR